MVILAAQMTCVAILYCTQLHSLWSEWSASNTLPPVPNTGALPNELHPDIMGSLTLRNYPAVPSYYYDSFHKQSKQTTTWTMHTPNIIWHPSNKHLQCVAYASTLMCAFPISAQVYTPYHNFYTFLSWTPYWSLVMVCFYAKRDNSLTSYGVPLFVHIFPSAHQSIHHLQSSTMFDPYSHLMVLRSTP